VPELPADHRTRPPFPRGRRPPTEPRASSDAVPVPMISSGG
jgi:hypothetical protein